MQEPNLLVFNVPAPLGWLGLFVSLFFSFCLKLEYPI